MHAKSNNTIHVKEVFRSHRALPNVNYKRIMKIFRYLCVKKLLSSGHKMHHEFFNGYNMTIRSFSYIIVFDKFRDSKIYRSLLIHQWFNHYLHIININSLMQTVTKSDFVQKYLEIHCTYSDSIITSCTSEKIRSKSKVWACWHEICAERAINCKKDVFLIIQCTSVMCNSNLCAFSLF